MEGESYKDYRELEPQTGLLLWMLDDVRKELLEGLQGLTKEQLMSAPCEGEYALGAYLLHQCQADAWWYSVMSGKEFSSELIKKFDYKWFMRGENAKPPEVPLEPEQYIALMEEARDVVRAHIRGLKDAELDKEVSFKHKEKEYSMSVRWIIYHLIEHEAHHRGQMFLLKRKGGLGKKGFESVME
jgi:uncharacterized damage-inducible protein DinB